MVINDWCESASIVVPTTPTSQRHACKKTRADQPTNLTTPQPARPIMWPNFTSHLTPQPTQPTIQPTFTSRFQLPHDIDHFADENVFQMPHPPMQSHHSNPIPRQPSSYAEAVSSPSAPSLWPTLHTPCNPYQHFLNPTYSQSHHYSPLHCQVYHKHQIHPHQCTKGLQFSINSHLTIHHQTTQHNFINKLYIS